MTSDGLDGHRRVVFAGAPSRDDFMTYEAWYTSLTAWSLCKATLELEGTEADLRTIYGEFSS